MNVEVILGFIMILVIGSLRNGMDILGWTTAKQNIAIGLVLIAAVYSDIYSKKKQ